MKVKKIKKNLLFALQNVHPLLKETADFYLFGSLGYDLAHAGKFLGDSKVADIRRAEIQGLKDAYRRVENICEGGFKNVDGAKKRIISLISKLKGDDRFYNFSIERMIEIVKYFDNRSLEHVPDTSWNVTYIEDQEVFIPGKSHGIDSLMNQEKKIYWKTYSFLSQLKKYFTKGVMPSSSYCYFPLKLSKVMNNFEIQEKNVQTFIFTRLSQVLGTFYPSLHFEGTRIKMSIYPPLFFFVLTSIDVICIFLLLDREDQDMLFLLPISKYSKDYKVIHMSLLQRFCCFLENEMKEEYQKPLNFWIEKDYLHCCIPPDAQPYFRKDGIVLLFSRKTGFFFHCVEEGDPYYRVTILPQEYLELLFSQNYKKSEKGGVL